MLTIEDIQTLGQAPVVDQAVIEAVAREEYKIAQASPATKEEVMEDAVIWLESLLVDFWQPDNQAYLRQYIDRWKAVLVPSAYEPGPELEPEWAKLPWAEPPVHPATTMPVYDVPTKPAVPVAFPELVRELGKPAVTAINVLHEKIGRWMRERPPVVGLANDAAKKIQGHLRNAIPYVQLQISETTGSLHSSWKDRGEQYKRWQANPALILKELPVYKGVPGITPVAIAPVARRLLPTWVLPTAIGVGALGIGGTILWLVLRRR